MQAKSRGATSASQADLGGFNSRRLLQRGCGVTVASEPSTLGAGVQLPPAAPSGRVRGMIPGVQVSKMPRCRWCRKEPEFGDSSVPLTICGYCEAIQDPILNLRHPLGMALRFYMNPDGSLYVEYTKKDGTTLRYDMSEEMLKRSGVLTSFRETPEGKRYGT